VQVLEWLQDVKIINCTDELDKVQQGDILVTVMTTPDMVPAMNVPME
jgi:phosphoenolpyruvate synthase/pyruvate phosphate dikinase